MELRWFTSAGDITAISLDFPQIPANPIVNVNKNFRLCGFWDVLCMEGLSAPSAKYLQVHFGQNTQEMMLFISLILKWSIHWNENVACKTEQIFFLLIWGLSAKLFSSGDFFPNGKFSNSAILFRLQERLIFQTGCLQTGLSAKFFLTAGFFFFFLVPHSRETFSKSPFQHKLCHLTAGQM